MSVRRKAKPPQLRVVFDSNAIYNQTGHYLLKHEVFELITSHADHADVEIAWYLPEVVRHERQYQMLQQGANLLPPVQKLEKILGHNLNITEQIIRTRIDQLIDQQIAELRINVLPLQQDQIDWREVMLGAAYRRPPFSATEKEKGFRDALIVEAFVQLVDVSPQTPRVCRLVLVTGDQLVADAVAARTASRSNVKVLPSLDELKGLINTLVSEVTEEFVTQMRDRATAYFYEKGNDQSLYVREKLGERIQSEFAAVLREPPEGASRVELESVAIGPTRFKEKLGQRVTWVSRVTLHGVAYRYEPVVAPERNVDVTGRDFLSAEPYRYDFTIPRATDFMFQQVASPGLEQQRWQSIRPAQLTFPSATFKKLSVKTGDISFEVTWSVTISANRQSLSAPRIEEIRHVDSSWEGTA